jgi:hypothetical protein
MKFMKIKLLVIALIMFAASSAFASLSYDVTVDTSSLAGDTGYLYLQYTPANAVSSTATVSNFVTDGALGAQSLNVVNGSAVTGTLPGAVVFANTNGINDYNHAITFGTSINFSLLFASTPGTPAGGVSTFSLGLFSDEGGLTPLLNTSGANAGTLLMVNLMNDGTTSSQALVSQAAATPTPIPAAAWLLGSGIMGLAGIRRRKQI